MWHFSWGGQIDWAAVKAAFVEQWNLAKDKPVAPKAPKAPELAAPKAPEAEEAEEAPPAPQGSHILHGLRHGSQASVLFLCLCVLLGGMGLGYLGIQLYRRPPGPCGAPSGGRSGGRSDCWPVDGRCQEGQLEAQYSLVTHGMGAGEPDVQAPMSGLLSKGEHYV